MALGMTSDMMGGERELSGLLAWDICQSLV